MAGLIAILAPGSAAPITDAELASLGRSYTALRGAAPVHRVKAGALGTAALYGGPAGVGAGWRAAGESWALHVGEPHATGELTAADPASLDGQFALIAYDAAAGRVDIVSDAFGLQAIYLAERGGATYVSTSVLALARHLGSRPSARGL